MMSLIHVLPWSWRVRVYKAREERRQRARLMMCVKYPLKFVPQTVPDFKRWGFTKPTE